MSAITPAVLAELAPGGVLRAAINFGNPVLAQKGQDGAPQGVSVALAKALAEELGVPLEMRTPTDRSSLSALTGGCQLHPVNNHGESAG